MAVKDYQRYERWYEINPPQQYDLHPGARRPQKSEATWFECGRAGCTCVFRRRMEKFPDRALSYLLGFLRSSSFALAVESCRAHDSMLTLATS